MLHANEFFPIKSAFLWHSGYGRYFLEYICGSFFWGSINLTTTVCHQECGKLHSVHFGCKYRRIIFQPVPHMLPITILLSTQKMVIKTYSVLSLICWMNPSMMFFSSVPFTYDGSASKLSATVVVPSSTICEYGFLSVISIS